MPPKDYDELFSNADASAPFDTQDYVRQIARKFNLPENLALSVARVESNFNPTAVSPAGAQGVMQLMPRTAASLGVTDPMDPRQNIEGGLRYLRQLQDQFPGRTDLALAAYNAGPGAVQRHGGIPPFPETQQYVQKVMGNLQGMEQTPSVGQAPASTAPDYDSIQFPQPSTLDTLAGAAGSAGRWIQEKAATAPLLSQFGQIMSGQRNLLENTVYPAIMPAYGKHLAWDPATKDIQWMPDASGTPHQSVGEHIAGLIGQAVPEDIVPKTGWGGMVRGAASGLGTAGFGMALDPVTYELAGLGKVGGALAGDVGGYRAGAGTLETLAQLQPSAANAVKLAMARFGGAHPGLTNGILYGSRLLDVAFKTQMALGAAGSLPQAFERLEQNPQDPLGWQQLTEGAVDAWFTVHSLLPKSAKVGPGEATTDLGTKVRQQFMGMDGQLHDMDPVAYTNIVKDPSFQFTLDFIDRLHNDFKAGDEAPALPYRFVYGLRDPKTGKRARGEMVTWEKLAAFDPEAQAFLAANPKRRLDPAEIWLDPSHIAGDVLHAPEGMRGNVFKQILAETLNHEWSHYNPLTGEMIPHPGKGPVEDANARAIIERAWDEYQRNPPPGVVPGTPAFSDKFWASIEAKQKAQIPSGDIAAQGTFQDIAAMRWDSIRQKVDAYWNQLIQRSFGGDPLQLERGINDWIAGLVKSEGRVGTELVPQAAKDLAADKTALKAPPSLKHLAITLERGMLPGEEGAGELGRPGAFSERARLLEQRRTQNEEQAPEVQQALSDEELTRQIEARQAAAQTPFRAGEALSGGDINPQPTLESLLRMAADKKLSKEGRKELVRRMAEAKQREESWQQKPLDTSDTGLPSAVSLGPPPIRPDDVAPQLGDLREGSAKANVEALLHSLVQKAAGASRESYLPETPGDKVPQDFEQFPLQDLASKASAEDAAGQSLIALDRHRKLVDETRNDPLNQLLMLEEQLKPLVQGHQGAKYAPMIQSVREVINSIRDTHDPVLRERLLKVVNAHFPARDAPTGMEFARRLAATAAIGGKQKRLLNVTSKIPTDINASMRNFFDMVDELGAVPYRTPGEANAGRRLPADNSPDSMVDQYGGTQTLFNGLPAFARKSFNTARPEFNRDNYLSDWGLGRPDTLEQPPMEHPDAPARRPTRAEIEKGARPNEYRTNYRYQKADKAYYNEAGQRASQRSGAELYNIPPESMHLSEGKPIPDELRVFSRLLPAIMGKQPDETLPERLKKDLSQRESELGRLQGGGGFAQKVLEATKQEWDLNGPKANLGNVAKQFEGPERGSAMKLAKSYLDAFKAGKTPETGGGGLTPPPGQLAALQKQIDDLKSQLEAAPERLQKQRQGEYTPQEWRQTIEGLPPEQQPRPGEMDYTGFMDYLKEQEAAGRQTIPVGELRDLLQRHSAEPKPEHASLHWQDIAKKAWEGTSEAESFKQRVTAAKARKAEAEQQYVEAKGKAVYGDETPEQFLESVGFTPQARTELLDEMGVKDLTGILDSVRRFAQESPTDSSARKPKIAAIQSVTQHLKNIKKWLDNPDLSPEAVSALRNSFEQGYNAKVFKGVNYGDDYLNSGIFDGEGNDIINNVIREARAGQAPTPDQVSFLKGALQQTYRELGQSITHVRRLSPLNTLVGHLANQSYDSAVLSPPYTTERLQQVTGVDWSSLPLAERESYQGSVRGWWRHSKNSPLYKIAQKLYERATAGNPETDTRAIEQQLEQADRELSNANRDVEYGYRNSRIPLVRDTQKRLQAGSTWAGYTRTSTGPTTSYGTTRYNPMGDRRISEQEVRNLGFELGGVEEVAGPNGTKNFVAHYKAVGRPEELTALTPKAVPGEPDQGITPSGEFTGYGPSREAALQDARRSAFYALGGYQRRGDADTFHGRDLSGLAHSRQEVLKLNPNSPGPDTYVASENQGDQPQKFEKVGSGLVSGGWQEAQRLLGKSPQSKARVELSRALGFDDVFQWVPKAHQKYHDLSPDLIPARDHIIQRALNYSGGQQLVNLARNLGALPENPTPQQIYDYISSEKVGPRYQEGEPTKVSSIRDFRNAIRQVLMYDSEWRSINSLIPAGREGNLLGRNRLARQIGTVLTAGWPMHFPFATEWADIVDRSQLADAISRPELNHFAMPDPGYGTAGQRPGIGVFPGTETPLDVTELNGPTGKPKWILHKTARTLRTGDLDPDAATESTAKEVTVENGKVKVGGTDLSFETEMARRFLKAIEDRKYNVDASGEMTPESDKALTEAMTAGLSGEELERAKKWEPRTLMDSPVYRYATEIPGAQDAHGIGGTLGIDSTVVNFPQIVRILSKLEKGIRETATPENYAKFRAHPDYQRMASFFDYGGYNKQHVNEALAKGFGIRLERGGIEGFFNKRFDNVAAAMREVGYKQPGTTDEGVVDRAAFEKALKDENPDATLIELPKSPQHPAYVSLDKSPDVTGTGKKLWLWLKGADNSLKSKLPAVQDGDIVRWRRPGETQDGKGFFSEADLYGPPKTDPLHGAFGSSGYQSELESLSALRHLIPHDIRKKLSEIDHPVWEAINAPRALITSLDLSGVLRQGFIATARQAFTSPRELKDNFLGSIRALKDENFYQQSMKSLDQHPLAGVLKDLGLETPKAEEAFAGTRALTAVAKKFGLPNFPRASERAYNYYLHRIRFDMAKDKFMSLRNMGFDPMKDRALFESATRWANIITGRGNLPKGDNPLAAAVKQSEGLMNTLLFSPRLMLARMALLNPLTYGRTFMAGYKSQGALGGLRATANVHAGDLAAMTAFIGATTSALAAMYGGTIEKDPRSSDFAQAKIGNTRVDLTGGLRTYINLAARLVSGETQTLHGNVRPQERVSTIGKFIRGKLSPVPGLLLNAASGSDVTGQNFWGPALDVLKGSQPLDGPTASEIIKKVVVDPKTLDGIVSGVTLPMILRDIRQVAAENPSLAAGLALPLVMGAGVSAHQLQPGLTTSVDKKFRDLLIEPIAASKQVQTPFKDLAGKPISLDAPYMLQKKMQDEIDTPLYQQIEKVVNGPGFESLPPIAQRVVLLNLFGALYKQRGAQQVATYPREKLLPDVQKKMVPDQWKTLGGPPITSYEPGMADTRAERPF